jgi:predicted dinucleotide-binding enzyme
MRVGILGSGLMGGKLGLIFARAGHEVVSATRGATTNSSGWLATHKPMHALVRQVRLRKMQTPFCLPCIGPASTM